MPNAFSVRFQMHRIALAVVARMGPVVCGGSAFKTDTALNDSGSTAGTPLLPCRRNDTGIETV